MGAEQLLHIPSAISWIVGLIGILGNLASSIQSIIDLSSTLHSFGVPYSVTYLIFILLIIIGIAGHYGIIKIPSKK